MTTVTEMLKIKLIFFNSNWDSRYFSINFNFILMYIDFQAMKSSTQNKKRTDEHKLCSSSSLLAENTINFQILGFLLAFLLKNLQSLKHFFNAVEQSLHFFKFLEFWNWLNFVKNQNLHFTFSLLDNHFLDYFRLDTNIEKFPSYPSIRRHLNTCHFCRLTLCVK